jgi:transcriptional regulator with XRE-family HTH domain
MNPDQAQAEFIRAIRHRLVDLDWTDARLCKEAKVSKSHWSEIRNGRKGLTMSVAWKLAHAVGMTWTLTPRATTTTP